MSVRLDQVPPARSWLTPADETAPVVVSSRATTGASIDRRSERDRQRGVIGRERNAERCVSAYRDHKKKGTNR